MLQKLHVSQQKEDFFLIKKGLRFIHLKLFCLIIKPFNDSF